MDLQRKAKLKSSDILLMQSPAKTPILLLLCDTMFYKTLNKFVCVYVHIYTCIYKKAVKEEQENRK